MTSKRLILMIDNNLVNLLFCFAMYCFIYNTKTLKMFEEYKMYMDIKNVYVLIVRLPFFGSLIYYVFELWSDKTGLTSQARKYI